MSRFHPPTLAFIAVSTLALGIGYATGPNALLWILVIGAGLVFWLLAGWRGWGLMAGTALLLALFLAANGIASGHGPLWMSIGLLGGLSAWLLGDTVRRVNAVENVAGRSDMLRAALIRLLILDAVGLALTVVALTVRLRLAFFPALAIGVLLVVLLSRLLAAPRKEQSPD